MLCQTCRRTLSSNLRTLQRRAIATAPATPNAAPTNPPPSTITPQTPATSSATPGTSQPHSTPFSPPLPPTITNPKDLKKPTKPQSSITGGTELKGLAYLKAHPQVLAKEDHEYPTWLWTLLEEPKTASGAPAVDLAAMTKRQRAKYDRKQERLMKDVPKPIPVHEQSRDLTGPDDHATVSLHKRQELTKSSREARRKGIRESNFLKGM